MTRVRRVRWIVGVGLVATAVTTLAVGARAMAEEGGSTARCVAPQSVSGPVHRDASWRTGALRAMGCHAWHRVHTTHRTLVRVSR